MVSIFKIQLTAVQVGAAGSDANQILHGLLVAGAIYVLSIVAMVVLQAAVFRAALYPDRKEVS